jgi:hypothetical protein
LAARDRALRLAGVARHACAAIPQLKSKISIQKSEEAGTSVPASLFSNQMPRFLAFPEVRFR